MKSRGRYTHPTPSAIAALDSAGSGKVERAGKDVKRLKTGDLVVASTGMAGGGHAQYACLPEQGALAMKPDSLSWEEAVAIPFGANTALYYLRDLGKIQAGQELLIIGNS